MGVPQNPQGKAEVQVDSVVDRLPSPAQSSRGSDKPTGRWVKKRHHHRKEWKTSLESGISLHALFVPWLICLPLYTLTSPYSSIRFHIHVSFSLSWCPSPCNTRTKLSLKAFLRAARSWPGLNFNMTIWLSPWPIICTSIPVISAARRMAPSVIWVYLFCCIPSIPPMKSFRKNGPGRGLPL